MNSGPIFQGQIILIIDDTPANLEVISNYLEGVGFEIVVAQDGTRGLEIAKRVRPDLILLDVLMPELDGFEVCRRLKAAASTRDIPVIFMTALAEMEDKITGFEVGGVDYITKPVQMDEVLARVRTHLALRAMQKQLTDQNVRLQQEILMRQRAEEGLRQAQVELEQRVVERTAELAQANASLKAEINERQRWEAQYYQAQKMEAIGRLTGGVAHDFNNILTIILGNSELLLQRLAQGHSFRQEVEQIRQSAERAAALTRQLLAFSRQQILQPHVLDLNDIVVNLEKMLRRLIGEDIDLITILERQLGPVKADAGQIEQVIMNLVVNARDAMPGGGRLTIETTNVCLDEIYSRQNVGVVAGPYVMLAVSDTGIGMDAQTQARIFDPFFTTKPQGKGTGLGLATAHGIISQSGGHISVYSKPGQGTTFKIYLPQVDPGAQVVRSKHGSVRPERGWETILLIEDEERVRGLIQQILTGEGYKVLKAKNSVDAHQVCVKHKGPIHLLLTDVIIPGGQNGVQLAKALTARYPEMKVLYISGYTDNMIAHQGMLDPDVAFLPKPFTLSSLLGKVREVLDTP